MTGDDSIFIFYLKGPIYQRQLEHVFYTAWSFPFALGIMEG